MAAAGITCINRRTVGQGLVREGRAAVVFDERRSDPRFADLARLGL
jgi:hypothetical protein